MKVAQSSLVEEPFVPVPAAPSPLAAGIDWKTCPPLLGYNSTKPKPTADIALATELGEPLLATWRYGLGQTAAFTSDAAARWAGEWLTWDGYGKFWAQVVRGLLRKSEQAAFQVRQTELGDGSRLRLDIDALTPEGGFRDRLPIDVTALDAGSGQTRTARAEQTGPGSYRAEFDLSPAADATRAGNGDDHVLGQFARAARAALRFRPHSLLSARVPAHRGERRFSPRDGCRRARPVRPDRRRRFLRRQRIFRRADWI